MSIPQNQGLGVVFAASMSDAEAGAKVMVR